MSLEVIFIIFIVCLIGLALIAIGFCVAFILENRKKKKEEKSDIASIEEAKND